MRKYLVLAGLLFLGGAANAQEFPRVETAPDFTYVRTAPVLGGSQSFNCAGGGGTIAVNLTSMIGLAADLGDCRAFGLNNTYGVGSRVNGNEFTYVFGPRITFRNASRFQPFFDISFGGERVSIACNSGNFGNSCGGLSAGQLPTGTTVVTVANPGATRITKNAFAMTVGGGLDIKINRRFAVRLVQAEYLYTHFGNGNCPLAVCNQNNSQNSFRLTSGIVMSWGGQ